MLVFKTILQISEQNNQGNFPSDENIHYVAKILWTPNHHTYMFAFVHVTK